MVDIGVAITWFWVQTLEDPNETLFLAIFRFVLNLKG